MGWKWVLDMLTGSLQTTIKLLNDVSCEYNAEGGTCYGTHSGKRVLIDCYTAAN